FIVFGNNVFGVGFKSIAEYFFAVEKNNLIYLATVIYLVGLITSIWFTLRKQEWRPLIWYFLVAAAVTGAAVGAGPKAAAEAGIKMRPLALVAPVVTAAAGTISVTVVGAAVGFEAAAAVEWVAGVAAVTFAGLIPILVKNGKVSGDGGVAIAVISIASALVGWYLSHRSLKTEEPLLLPLRKLRLVFRCWGGTDFRGATLVNTDFSEADFKNANFYGSTIIRCIFQNALNLHLANTLNTPLEPLEVRQLVLAGQTEVKDFSYHNLRGVVFAGLNLQGCKFHHADLCEADLRGCILKDCDFTETMAYGALFDHAEFTAAIIDNWSIDKATQFNDAKAKFVYLKRDKSECNPPQGEFKEGDFAKLYQDIANTVDFIAHTPAELQALLRAIEKIKDDGIDIFIQQMERKADSVALRVQSE
ncbi:MAG: pentapeptide repeat-containing protein, partial [Methylotenera sp.]